MISNESQQFSADSDKCQASLPCYSSTEGLTLRVYDYSNFYLLPAICVFGITTSALNVFVLLKTGIAENIHLFMLVGSSSDLLFLLIQVFIAVFRCGVLCPFGYTYASKVYELYVYLYLGYAIVTFAAFVHISVSIDRIRLFSHSRTLPTRFHFAVRCAILFAVSAVLVMPGYALAREIVPLGVLVKTYGSGNQTYKTYETLYTKSMSANWLQPAIQVFLTVLSVAKGPALIALVLFVDIIVIIKFNVHLKKKLKLAKGECKTVSQSIGTKYLRLFNSFQCCKAERSAKASES